MDPDVGAHLGHAAEEDLVALNGRGLLTGDFTKADNGSKLLTGGEEDTE